MMLRLIISAFVYSAKNWAWAFVLLANAHAGVAEIDNALRSNDVGILTQTLQKLQSTGGEQAELNFLRGLIQLKLQQYEPAWVSFAAVPLTSSYYLDARNNMAAIQAAQGKFADAKNILEAAIRSNQTVELIHNNLDSLRAHLATKSYSSALQILDNRKNSKLTLLVSSGALTTIPKSGASSLASAVEAKALDTTAIKAAEVNKQHTTSMMVKKPQSEPQPPTASMQNSTAVSAAVQALNDWARAWERKDMQHYFNSYSPDFTPPEGKTREEWAKDRQSKIMSKSRIQIQLKQIEAKQLSNTAIRLRYRQFYQADQLKIASNKIVEMKWNGQHWLITQERSQ